jgi:hypothetical protein
MNKTEDRRRKTADGSKTHVPEQRLSFRPPIEGKGPAAEQRVVRLDDSRRLTNQGQTR